MVMRRRVVWKELRRLERLKIAMGKVRKRFGETEDKLDKDEDNGELDEADLVKPPPHWLPKACICLVVAGGCISEEEVFSLLSTHGNVSSITFEEEKRDSAIIRFDCS
eukprot:TRINITY_DN19752_c0_g1_i6.p3 TRINITY_DN19752_c0_g1~~TRINITY_DN19752_c0_g1_i6.p3  ORF type:complete len:108 (-),score=24.63 TRINITY_DN19752_c0_g1_i6:2510-2833(-)